MDPINYYKILQVDREAEPEVIKAAYRALSRKYHPDGTHPSSERMVRLNDAYAVLSDPAGRSRHNDEIEMRDFSAGRAERPSAAPRMRYQETVSEPPRPRRKYRRFEGSVLLNIMVISLCVITVIASGALRPFVSPPPSPSPTPPAYQVGSKALQTSFENSGFVFDTDYELTGVPLQRGTDGTNVATVIIEDSAGSIRFASLLLSQRQDLASADQSEESQALSMLLNATFGPYGGRDSARSWITQRIGQSKVFDAVIISGWAIRVWPAADEQMGIAILPAAQ